MRNEFKSPGERRMSFGKYIGRKYKNVPTEYLEWFVKNSYHQMVDRTRWAEEELKRRLKN